VATADSVCAGVNLNLPYGFESASPLKAEFDPANAGEQ
jgi:hypothetical protein